MASVRPFQFSGLPAYTKQQVALTESLAVHLSRRPWQPSFADAVARLAKEMLQAPYALQPAELRSIPRPQLAATLGQEPCLALIGTQPQGHKILIDIDPDLAALAIDRLLGGKGEAIRPQRPFTDIETGVLSFPVLRLLALFQENHETGRELALTLEGFASSLDSISGITEGVDSYELLSYRLAIGRRSSYVRLLIPDALISQHFGAALPLGGANAADRAYMSRVLASLGEVAVTARLTVSKLDLRPADVRDVGPGDIIVLEDHQLRIEADGIVGEVMVTLGDGRNGGFVGRVVNNVSDASQAWLEVVRIIQQEQPMESEMSTNQPEDEDGGDNLPETEALLRDVAAPVVVELGRIRMNAAQVSRLRSGQILRLTRGPHDPVDLVVNGKLFARGELIEVDGELGVRLTQVTAAE